MGSQENGANGSENGDVATLDVRHVWQYERVLRSLLSFKITHAEARPEGDHITWKCVDDRRFFQTRVQGANMGTRPTIAGKEAADLVQILLTQANTFCTRFHLTLVMLIDVEKNALRSGDTPDLAPACHPSSPERMAAG